jgi:hypothetical protein
MSRLLRTGFLFVMLMMASSLCPLRSLAVEVFVNGEEFTSMRDYRQKRAMDNTSAEAAGVKPKAKTAPALPVPKASPLDFDPAKGKTVVISADGSLREEKGVKEPLEGVGDGLIKEKTIEVKPSVQPASDGLKDKGPAAVSVGAGQKTEIVDHGRIAGVEPPLSDVVRQFQSVRGNQAAVRVSSAQDLEENLRKALQSTAGVVLLVAGDGKVRLYDLQGPLSPGKTSDGQKTR